MNQTLLILLAILINAIRWIKLADMQLRKEHMGYKIVLSNVLC